jgi:hypothetical protein
MIDASSNLESFSVLNLLKCDYYILPVTQKDANSKYFIIPAHPATGILYVTNNNPEFISGHNRLKVRMKEDTLTTSWR